MCQTFSIGFISGDWPGHGKIRIAYSSFHVVVVLALWQGVPSSTKVASSLDKMALSNIGSSPSVNIWIYFAAFIFPSQITNCDLPPYHIAPHTMMFTPPYFTV
ncbi:hypothetical protein Trydic_g11385 [Trypoxylus dichotomus]